MNGIWNHLSMDKHHSKQLCQISRRGLFQQVASGLGTAAVASLLNEDVFASGDTLPRMPHSQPRAKAVIHLFMNGGPSQMDLLDPKPELTKHHGEDYFERIAGEVEFPDAAGSLMRSPFEFSQHGESGIWVSELMPHLATQVDKLAIIRSLQTTNLTHEPALYKIQSGSEFTGRPSIGAWVSYGLGTVNRNLPAYVVLDDPLGLPVNGVDNWQAGYLPPVHQGTRFRATGSPVLNLEPAFEEPDSVRSVERELIARLDRIHRRDRPGRPQLDARISSYELAARMQLAATDALDLSEETAETQKRYGIDQQVTESYGRRCLIARRLVETRRAVRATLHQQPDLGQPQQYWHVTSTPAGELTNRSPH